MGARAPGRLVTLALLAVALIASGCGGAEERAATSRGDASVLRERRVAPRVVDLEIRSRALRTTAMVRLLTPVGWNAGRRTRDWPVLYLLHGCCDTYASWTRSTDIELWPQLRRVLVVMPEGGPVGFYTNWVGDDDRRGPGWETFHLQELPRLLARDYGASPQRAVAGLSMGGLGAMGYSARHPGFFRAAASFSGLLHPLADVRFLRGLFAAFTPDPDAIWGSPGADRDGWTSHDPTALVARLRGTPLFVSAGDGRPGPLDARGAGRDQIERTVLRESRAFVSRARALHVAVHADFYGAGRHDWPYWERELRRALPLLLAPLKPS